MEDRNRTLEFQTETWYVVRIATPGGPKYLGRDRNGDACIKDLKAANRYSDPSSAKEAAKAAREKFHCLSSAHEATITWRVDGQPDEEDDGCRTQAELWHVVRIAAPEGPAYLGHDRNGGASTPSVKAASRYYDWASAEEAAKGAEEELRHATSVHQLTITWHVDRMLDKC